MEVALTFGAVGDIIAVCQLIKDIVSALDDCRGSSKKYRDLIHSLGVLNDALREVHHVFSHPPRASINQQRLCAAGLSSIKQVQESLQSFNDKLGKFRSSLGPRGSGNCLKDAARKIQFKLDDKDIEGVKGEITGYTVALRMLLETLTM